MDFRLLVAVIGLLNLLAGYALGVHWRREQWRRWNAAAASRTLQSPADDVSGGLVAGSDPVTESEQFGTTHLDAPPHQDATKFSATSAQPEVSDPDSVRHLVDVTTANLTDFVKRVKQGSWSQSDRSAWGFVGELKGICEPYLRHLTKASELFSVGADDPGQEVAFSEETQQFIVEQLAQLETTLSNLGYMDFDADFPAAMSRLRVDAENTLAAARALGNALQATHVTAGDQ